MGRSLIQIADHASPIIIVSRPNDSDWQDGRSDIILLALMQIFFCQLDKMSVLYLSTFGI